MCKFNIDFYNYFLLFLGSILLSLLLNKLLILFAYRYNCFLDKPNIRSSHAKIIPRCGGGAICLITLAACVFLFKSTDLRVIGYLLGALLIFVVGVIDDLVSMSSKPKIAGMVLSSMIPLFFGLRLEYLNVIFNNQLVLYLLSFVWIYGFINALNFMDGINGLVGGSASIGAFFLLILAALTGNTFVFGVSLVLIATCLGFLAFNFNSASIFLGDAGSMFLGYNVAVLGIMLTNGSANLVPIYLTILIFAPMIYDSMVTFVFRGLQGKNVIEAHREHIYQRLIILGVSHRNVSLVYYALSLLFGLLALLFLSSKIEGRITISILALIVMVGFNLLVKRIEFLKISKNNKNAV